MGELRYFFTKKDNGRTGLLTWKLNKDTLIISGNGAMPDYSSSYDVPWLLYKNPITTVIIEEGVTCIGKYAFKDCKKLTSISIPKSVIKIESWAFDKYYTSFFINVDKDNSTYSSEDGILFDKSKSVLIKYPANKLDTHYIVPDSVITIEDFAFKNCENLTSITLPNNVKSIGVFAFSGSGLSSIIIPNSVTKIEIGTFAYCCNLTSVTIPNGVTNISFEAFNGCKNLTSMIIPDSVTEFNNYAFQPCTKLVMSRELRCRLNENYNKSINEQFAKLEAAQNAWQASRQ